MPSRIARNLPVLRCTTLPVTVAPKQTFPNKVYD